jgi:hypothetical protein
MKRKHPEDDIQRAVVQHLRARATPGTVYWHTPNGGHRNMIEAVRFKSLGVRAGVSDIIALRNKEAFALELKAPGGRPTEAQLEFQSDFRAAGGHAVVAEGLDEALRILEAWNLLKRSA